MPPLIPGVQAVILVDFEGNPIDIDSNGALPVTMGGAGEVKTVNSSHNAASSVDAITAVTGKKICILGLSAVVDPEASAPATAVRFAFAGVGNKKVYGAEFGPGKGFVWAFSAQIEGGITEPLKITLDQTEVVEYTIHYREV